MTFQMPPIDQDTVAVIVAGLSAIIVKLIERWSKESTKTETPVVVDLHVAALGEAELIRKELREEIERHQDDKDKLRKEADKWRAKYWSTQSDVETSTRRVGELQTEIEALRQHVEKLLPGEDSSTDEN